jgi:hypothetical protein
MLNDHTDSRRLVRLQPVEEEAQPTLHNQFVPSSEQRGELRLGLVMIVVMLLRQSSSLNAWIVHCGFLELAGNCSCIC